MKYIPKAEYAKLINEINTNYSRFKTKKFVLVPIDDKLYYIRINQFNDYDILWVGDNYD